MARGSGTTDRLTSDIVRVALRHAYSSIAGVLQRLGTIEVKQVEADKKFDTIFDALDRSKLIPCGILPANTEFDSIRQVSHLVESAKSEVVVIDLFDPRREGDQEAPCAVALTEFGGQDPARGLKGHSGGEVCPKPRKQVGMMASCAVWDRPHPLVGAGVDDVANQIFSSCLRRAMAIASERLETPSFSKSSERWFLTVISVMPSSRAMSALVCPRVMEARMSR